MYRHALCAVLAGVHVGHATPHRSNAQLGVRPLPLLDVGPNGPHQRALSPDERHRSLPAPVPSTKGYGGDDEGGGDSGSRHSALKRRGQGMGVALQGGEGSWGGGVGGGRFEAHIGFRMCKDWIFFKLN